MKLAEIQPIYFTSAKQPPSLYEQLLQFFVWSANCVIDSYLWLMVKFAGAKFERIPAPAERPEELEAESFDVQASETLWRELLLGSSAEHVVVFAHQTVVVLERSTDPRSDAKTILRQLGVSKVGTPSADMSVYPMPNGQFVVGCADPRVFVALLADARENEEFLIGMLGRAARDRDAESLQIVHTFRMDNSMGD